MRAFSRVVSAGVVLALVAMMVLAGLFVSAPVARADASSVSWVDYGQITGQPGFGRFAPTVVSDGVSSLYVFYFTTQTATGATNINVTKYSLGTNILGLPTQLFDTQVNDVANLVAHNGGMSGAIDSAGNIYLAWTHVPFGTSPSAIYVSKSSDGGLTWGAAVHASGVSTVAEAFQPSLAVSPAGTIYVAWTQRYGGFFNVTVAQSTNGGTSFTGQTNASGQGAGGFGLFGSLTVDAGGRLYLGYLGYTPGLPLPEHVNLTTSNDGLTWASPKQLTPDSTLALQPTAATDGSGHVHLFWFDYRGLLTTGTLTLWHSMSTNRGATWTAGSPVSQGVTTPNSYPRVSSHGAEVLVSWAASASGQNGMVYIVSADGGLTWSPERFFYNGYTIDSLDFASDQNGTFYAAVTDSSTTYNTVRALVWFGPPSAPVITSVTTVTNSLNVTWAASPEPDVAGYQVYRSTNGVDFTLLATLGAGNRSYVDSGLADGTYWYEVVAVDGLGTTSAPSAPWSGTVGPTLAQLQAEITALQNALNSANANLASIQTQLTALKGQISSLQGNTSALQTQLNNLQNQLNSMQSAQATQTMSYANLAFEVIVVVLLIVVLLNQMRKPKTPQLMMAEPAQAPPKKDDDL